MIRLMLMDGSTMEISREEATELLPYRIVFHSPLLKAPIEGLINHRGKLIPVLGPLAETGEEILPVDQRPWLLLLKDCAQVIRGLPEFQESAQVIPIRGDSSPETAREAA